MGILNEFSLWPWMIGRERALASDEDVVEEALRMFLQRYRPPQRQVVSGRGTAARRRSRKPAGQS
jgi:TetR/AcrR family transcriptional regulator of autoinduction and epiphytic fitness